MIYEKLKQYILELSRKYSISTPTIEYLILLLLYLKYFENDSKNSDKLKTNEIDLINELDKFLSIIQKPKQKYGITINSRIVNKKNDNYSILIKDLYNKWKKIAILDPVIFNISYLPIEGPFSLTKLDNEITIDRFTAESVMIGADLYVPAVRKIKFDFKLNDLVSIFAPGQIHVSNGKFLLNKKQIQQSTNGVAIKNLESIYKMYPYKNSEFYENGLILEQNLSSLLACWCLMYNYQSDMEILDTCAAPGHKTCTISQIGLYLNDFEKFPSITAVDRSTKRLNTLNLDIKRLKLNNIKVIRTKLQRLEKEYPEFKEKFDLLMLDPPCSALGIQPKLSIEYTWNDLRSFFLLQHIFAKVIDNFIKPGGYLLYNTCSLTILENEAIISYFKSRFNYKIIDVFDILNKLFPRRFKMNNRFYELHTISDQNNLSEFGSELFYGIPRNNHFIEYILNLYENIKDKDYYENLSLKEHSDDDFKYHYISDTIYYNLLTEEEARKVVRTYPIIPNTPGYFFALLNKS